MNQKGWPGDYDISKSLGITFANEYLPALLERTNARSKAKQEAAMNKGAIVLLGANWTIGRIIDQVVGKDGVSS